jgi:hypothetical protein
MEKLWVPMVDIQWILFKIIEI